MSAEKVLFPGAQAQAQAQAQVQAQTRRHAGTLLYRTFVGTPADCHKGIVCTLPDVGSLALAIASQPVFYQSWPHVRVYP